LDNNQLANEVLLGLTETAGTVSKTVSVGAFALNVFLSASLSLLWGMINALQIIGHLPYLNVFMPASAEMFFSIV
jgi:hypothetical protein